MLHACAAEEQYEEDPLDEFIKAGATQMAQEDIAKKEKATTATTAQAGIVKSIEFVECRAMEGYAHAATE